MSPGVKIIFFHNKKKQQHQRIPTSRPPEYILQSKKELWRRFCEERKSSDLSGGRTIKTIYAYIHTNEGGVSQVYIGCSPAALTHQDEIPNAYRTRKFFLIGIQLEREQRRSNNWRNLLSLSRHFLESLILIEFIIYLQHCNRDRGDDFYMSFGWVLLIYPATFRYMRIPLNCLIYFGI